MIGFVDNLENIERPLAPAQNQRELLHNWSHLPLRMPQSGRELIQLMTLYDPTLGLQDLISRINLTGVTPTSIFQLVHGRSPESISKALSDDAYDPGKHFSAALLSSEFQNNIMRLLLASYPEKSREVFIHIPKCAGTDLVLNVASRRLGVPQMLGLDGWISKEEFLTALSNFARAAPFYDDLFVYGHIELNDYVALAGVRPNDRIFTIIRDPIDLMLSQANYAVSRLTQDPTGTDPDTYLILRYLDLKALPENPSHEFLKNLAVRCLLDSRIAQPNRICHYLGKGKTPSYEQAIENVVTYNIEVTVAEKYKRWLQERWQLQTNSQHNRSISFLSKREASLFFSEQLAPLILEDKKFFDVITWALNTADRSSIAGLDVARLAGIGLLNTLPSSLGLITHGQKTSSASVDLVAAHGAVNLDRYLQPIAEDLVVPDLLYQEAFAIDFGAKGNAQAFIKTGWALPEKNFTWTASTLTTVNLPRPNVAADYLLRILATPLTAAKTVPLQRMTLTVNGHVIGTGVAKEVVAFEADLPWSLVVSRPQLEISMSLPDAATPREVNGGPDERLLAFAVHKFSLLRCGRSVSLVTGSDQLEVAQGAWSETLPERDLMMLFESIGENCEFGLAQRACGAEPLGLLRFASTPYPKLIAALKGGLAGLGDAEALQVQISATGREYMVLDTCYQLLFHAWVEVGEKSPEEVHRREARRVPFLVRKLRETLGEATKIFVFHGMSPLTHEQAQHLCDALGLYGSATLLWVEVADNNHPALSVEVIGPRLLKGYIDRFAPGENAHDFSLPSWIKICREAHRLTHPGIDAKPRLGDQAVSLQ